MEEKEAANIELQRAREDLEDLEVYVKEFFSFLPLAICTINPPKIIMDVNQFFQTLSGYDFLEIIGEPLESIFLEKKGIGNLLASTYKKRTVEQKELTLVSKAGKNIPVSVSVSTRKDQEGNFIGYFLALSDITGTKKFREELSGKVEKRTKELEESRIALMNILEDVEDARKKTEEEKNKTLLVITNLADGLLVFDQEDKLSLINPKAEDFFKVNSKEILGKSFVELSEYPNLANLAKILKDESKKVFRKELTLNEDLILEISAIPMARGEEESGFLVITHDITREKTIERMKSEFVSISAHQLRTPLSAIKWTLRMMLDGDVGDITKEQRELLDKTYESNERMINLINDLLDITRIEEGKNLYRPILTDIESIIQFVVNSLKGEAEKRSLTLEFKKEDKKIPRIILDIDKMKLAVQNILDNAIRYTPLGGKVTVSVKYAKKEVEVSVKDSGVGIPQNQQKRIFTKFFRGANVIRMATEGTGLGLFITKNIIEAHGGHIRFESQENKGTTFYFTIPVKEEFGNFLKEF